MRYSRSRLSAPLFSYSRQTIPDDGENRKLQTTLSKRIRRVELGLVALDRVYGELLFRQATWHATLLDPFSLCY
jgi:hypothetical protein